jgi:hypothetical protein
MATEYTLVNGKLVETESKTTAEEYTIGQINEAITILSSRIAGEQAELVVWNARKTKLEELAG